MMDVSELEEWGKRLGKWSSEYLSSLRDRPVRAAVSPGEILAKLPRKPPEEGTELSEIFRNFTEIIIPGMTHWQHPRFFAYFPANSSPPSVVAEWITATLAAQCMLWQTSPAATELETAVMAWLRQMIGLPRSFTGIIQDTASSATLAAVLTMRERALNWEGNQKGLSGHPRLRIYCSDQVHSSIDKACLVAGIGQENLIKIPSSGELYSIDVAALDQQISNDIKDGFKPAGIIASVGGTSIGGSDDIDSICSIAEAHRLYVHVDAAWAGSAMICPEYRHFIKGVGRTDSFVVNPHKWLFTNFDCTAFFVKDPDSLVRTVGLRPAYLETLGNQDNVINYAEWSIPLGRRFRALKLWFVIRAYGVKKLQHMIRTHVSQAEHLAARLETEPDFEIVTQPILSLFSFRHCPHGVADLNAHNATLLQKINDDGRIYLTQTRVDGEFVIRFQVGQTYTEQQDIDTAFDVITETARSLS